MRALMHYALLKCLRERSLWAFLISPIVLIGAPLLGFAAEAAAHGRRAYPVVLFGTSLADSERFYIAAATGAVVAAAGAAAFWCFRSDIANRSLSFMLLALRHSFIVPLAAALCGCAVGVAAFLAVIPAVGLAVGMVTKAWLGAAVIAAVAVVVATAAGTAFAAYSPVPGTVVMVVLLALFITGGAGEALTAGPLPAVAGAIALAAALVWFAARGMERRCAA